MYIKLNTEGAVEAVVATYPGDVEYNRVGHVCETWDDVVRIAAQMAALTGEDYIPTDAGEWCSPRFDAVVAPKVGDKVSYAFNGDYTECGEITKISNSGKRVATSSGKVFYRRGNSASWLYAKTWALVQGHVNQRNPSF